jgi:ribosomal protein S18 acetylase RimI-like enzyme
MERERGLQERAARGQPASEVERVDGWWLRHAPGCQWWISTVLAHDEPANLLQAVIAAEEFYDTRGTACGFQITPGVCPDGLDDLLAERGYRHQDAVALLVATTAVVAAPPLLHARVDDQPSRAWLDVWHAVYGGDADAQWELLRRVEPSSAYASVVRDGDVIAVGRAVVDTGWAGVFGMATRPEARGSGAARAVLAALGTWASTAHAERMYLQVKRDNARAVRLYRSAGFMESCGFHYRVTQRR